MHPNSILRYLLIGFYLLAFSTCLLFPQAQTKQLQTLLDDLEYLATPTVGLEEQRAGVAQILSRIEFWQKLYPGASVSLPSVPPQPWSAGQTRDLISALKDTVRWMLKQNPGRRFEIGALEISVTAETSPLSPVVSGISHSEIRNLHMVDIAQSIPYLPGIGVDHNSSSGRSGIMIRGFDTRQVGFYLDGIPLYVPYDGFVDISRFLTSDISEIEVAKGYSSPLLGPNGLGGAVNLVTRRPEKKLHAEAAIGTGSGNMLESWLHLGSAWRDFYIQGGLDWLQTDHFPISGKFVPTSMQPESDRINSDRRDARYNGRLAWTPRKQNQYVLSYINQKSDYGVPPYSGIDTQNNKPKFWRWPYWNREMYYLNSNTALGDADSFKFRAFYDRYRNNMTGFTNATYSSISSLAPIDDHSIGTSAEYSMRRFSRHSLGISFFLKDDIHKESAVSYTGSSELVQPWRKHHDRLISVGIQDVITITSRMRGTVGFSADQLDAIDAQDLKTTVTGSGKNAVTTYSVGSFDCQDSDCLNRVWAYNPLASLSYSVSEKGSLFFAFTQKSHFPTLKDRYSYRYGRAIPNPALQPEHTRNWSLGYSHAFVRSTVLQADIFRNDVYDAIQNAIVPAEFENQCPSMAAGMCQKAVNIGKEMHQGVELAVRSNPVSRLAVNANYSYLNWTISGPPNMLGVHPVRAPKHKIVGIANLDLPREIHLLAAVRYESGTITVNDSGAIVPASKFATADLGLIVPLWKGSRLQTGINNLFDRNYYYQEGFPEPGRNWHFSVHYHF
ncbi:MAG: TonB-dependent receptor [Acidobacteria bacterium]|nr:TonB-dependent receptor [Acidobacteriota bacterium]